ncbi:penicillin-binding protein 2 [Frateuria sp. STR12]|uniref:penicillin-binding protein 2 n=1 Tax=Frateuria hangzhouensis TaxID=2995589 RepID=UPI002260B266|nr:penicillin-binding protein 2 [Frateuria sp. STR12]MCX7515199.1 penicillin-binding protein 2 [Frateuria sp. STR12]
MKKRRALKDPRGEAALFQRRSLVGFALILLGLLALSGRFFYLQVVRHDEFVTRSENNRVKPKVIPPARGLIYDRNGVLLADNVPAFRLEVVAEQVPDMKAMLAQIGAVVPLDDDDVADFKKRLKQSRRFESVPLKMHLSEDDIARFAINRWRFPGVDVVPYLTRHYPYGELFAHVIGYVGRIDAEDLKRLDPDRYQGTSHVGRSGLERSYEEILHGTPGYELVEVNADGRTQRVLETHPPIPGKNLYLSIDVRIQKAAMGAFDGRAGAAVAIDPRNGRVLAMVSVPSFDPNLFVNGISTTDYKALTSAPDKPLYNRALRGVYPPGSTVKPFLALGGLAYGIRKPEDTVLSTGEFCLPGASRCYRDDKRGGDGVVDMVQAIEKSTNTYFYKLAMDLGIDRLSTWMGRFGFGKQTGIDLDGEENGILPSREWKEEHSRQPWYPGETVIAGIGQGYWAVTPLQLGHALSILAGRGIPRAPKLVMATQDGVDAPKQSVPNPPTGPSLVNDLGHLDVIKQGMEAVVATGTGRKQFIGFPLVVAGKSGTAERYSRSTAAYDTNKSSAYLASRHRAWFEAFTPADDPKIAVVALLEAGAWGAEAAGPIVRSIMEAWLAAEGGVPAAPQSPGDTPVPVRPAQAGGAPVAGNGGVP